MGGTVIEWSAESRGALQVAGCNVRNAVCETVYCRSVGAMVVRCSSVMVVRGAMLELRGTLMVKKRWMRRRWNRESVVNSDRERGERAGSESDKITLRDALRVKGNPGVNYTINH